MRKFPVFASVLVLGLTLSLLVPIPTVRSSIDFDEPQEVVVASGPIISGDCAARCAFVGTWVCAVPGSPEIMCVTDGASCHEGDCYDPCEYPCN